MKKQTRKKKPYQNEMSKSNDELKEHNRKELNRSNREKEREKEPANARGERERCELTYRVG